MTYTIQVSNHPDAGRRLATEAGSKSWETKYDGPCSAPEVRRVVNELSAWYRNVRAFKGADVGLIFYQVARPPF